MSGPVPTTGDMSQSRRYHHGDLRNAVLTAALDLLAERGPEGVTLRQCAARAGVSHGAPGHHFGDLAGLLTAIAVIGFERLVDAMEAGGSAAPDRLAGIGAAYLRFSVEEPALFSLMFQRDRLREDDDALNDATAAAYTLFAQAAVTKFGERGVDMRAVRHLLWSLVHGYACLIMSGQIAPPEDFYLAARTAFAFMGSPSAPGAV